MKFSIRLTAILFLITTLFLKIAGLIRDILIANYFGDSYMADAYLAAFIIPNMFVLFLQNGMKNTFVPLFYQKEQQDKENEFLNNLIKGAWIIGFCASVIGVFIAPLLIQLLYPSFNLETASLATTILRILLASIVAVCVNALLESYLDAKHLYHYSAISQSIVWMTMIASTLLFAEKMGIYILAIGYLLGVIVSLLFKSWILRNQFNSGYSFNLSEIRNFYIQLIPLGLTVMVGQINLMIDNVFASYFSEGVITYINYAKNIVHFPQTIIAMVIGTVFFSFVSDAFSKKQMTTFQHYIQTSFQITFFLTIPAITGLAFILPYVVNLLFERGAFQAEATLNTVKVAYFYLGSALFFSLNIIWNKALYTIGKGKLILRISIISILLNVIGNYLFTMWLGYYGIPLASSFIGLYYTIATFFTFRKQMGEVSLQKGWKKELFRTIVATIVMSLALTFMMHSIQLPVLWQSISLILTGTLTYLGSAYLLKSDSLQALFSNIKGGTH